MPLPNISNISEALELCSPITFLSYHLLSLDLFPSLFFSSCISGVKDDLGIQPFTIYFFTQFSCILQTSDIILCLSFWVTSLNMLSPISIQVAAHCMISLLLAAVKYSTVYLDHSFILHSSIFWYLDEVQTFSDFVLWRQPVA